MSKEKIIIYGCPKCKEYLPKTDEYKYCMYCGWQYDKEKLIILEIIKGK